MVLLFQKKKLPGEIPLTFTGFPSLHDFELSLSIFHGARNHPRPSTDTLEHQRFSHASRQPYKTFTRQTARLPGLYCLPPSSACLRRVMILHWGPTPSSIAHGLRDLF